MYSYVLSIFNSYKLQNKNVNLLNILYVLVLYVGYNTYLTYKTFYNRVYYQLLIII